MTTSRLHAIIRAMIAADGIRIASCNVNSHCDLFAQRCTRPKD